MQQRIVIDTNIWKKAMVDKEYEMSCDNVINYFIQHDNLILALDDETKMENEYRKNIVNNRRFELRWKELDKKNRKYWVSSKLATNYADNLRKLGFHEPEDHVFVGTAMKTDKLLVTNDSDYGANDEPEKRKVFEYLRDKMKLSVYSSEKFNMMYK